MQQIPWTVCMVSHGFAFVLLSDKEPARFCAFHAGCDSTRRTGISQLTRFYRKQGSCLIYPQSSFLLIAVPRKKSHISRQATLINLSFLLSQCNLVLSSFVFGAQTRQPLRAPVSVDCIRLCDIIVPVFSLSHSSTPFLQGEGWL